MELTGIATVLLEGRICYEACVGHPWGAPEGIDNIGPRLEPRTRGETLGNRYNLHMHPAGVG